jgi:hypothetical protein
MRDEVAEALMEMDAESTTRILLRRLRESPDAPWAVAYALGRVAQEPRAIREIEQARRNQPRPAQIAFALAMAWAQRREFETALGLLDEAAGSPRLSLAVRTSRRCARRFSSSRSGPAASKSGRPSTGMYGASGARTSRSARR